MDVTEVGDKLARESLRLKGFFHILYFFYCLSVGVLPVPNQGFCTSFLWSKLDLLQQVCLISSSLVVVVVYSRPPRSRAAGAELVLPRRPPVGVEDHLLRVPEQREALPGASSGEPGRDTRRQHSHDCIPSEYIYLTTRLLLLLVILLT